MYFVAHCLENGWVVARVVGDCERYDCVIDRGNGLERIQIKTARMANGALVFSTASSTYHVPETCPTKHERRSYKGEIDAFGIYCPDLNRSYVVPVDEVGRRAGTLRIEPTKNKQTKNVRLAKSFEI